MKRTTSLFCLSVSRRLRLTAAAALVLAPSAQAGATTWANTATDFNTGANWIGGNAPGAGDNATFTDSAPTFQPDLSAPLTIQGLTFSTLAGGWTLGSSIFPSLLTLTNNGTAATSAINSQNTSGTNTVSLGIVLGEASGTSTITQTRGGALVLSGNISSTNPITGLSFAAGAGIGNAIFTLSGNNTYAGNTTLAGNEVVNLNSPTAISTGTLIFSASATIDNTSATAALTLQNNNINLSNGNLTYAGSVAGNSLNFGSGVVTVSGGNRTMTVNGGTVTVGSINTDTTARTFNKTGAGTLILNSAAGANFQGGFTFSGGVTQISQAAALGTGQITAQATLQSTADLTGANRIPNLVLVNGTTTIAGSNSIEFGGKVTGNSGGNRQFTNNLTSGTFIINDLDINKEAGVVRGVTFTGTGNTVVNGVMANGAGTTTANTLTVQGLAGSSVRLNNGGNTYSGGTTLSTSTATLVIGADSTPSAPGSTLTSGPIGTGGLVFTSGTLMAAGGPHVIANPITQFTGITIAGNNDLTLNGSVQWTATGTTPFTVNNTGTTTFGGVFTMRNGAGPTPSGNRFVTLQGTGNVVFAGPIVNGFSINGALSINSTGLTTLAGNNTYSGATSIGNGTVAATVKLGHTNALGFGGISNVAGSAVVAAGSTLDLNGQTSVNKLITLNGAGVGGAGALINSSTSTVANIGTGVTGLNIAGGTAGGGLGYSAPPAVTITGTGTGATAVASLGLTNASFTITPGDKVYSVAPTVTITGGGGQGAVGTAVLSDGVSGTVIGVTFQDGSGGPAADSRGTGYTSAPAISFSGGTLVSGTVDPTGVGNANNFQVVALQMTSPGTGYTGTPAVSIDAGTSTQPAVANAVVSGVVLNAPATIGGAGSIVLNNGLSGIGSLTKVGNGTLTLGGTSTYVGTTTVNAGTLLVNGMLTGSSMTVNNGATLAGTGAVGSVTVDGASFLRGGDGVNASGGLSSSGLLTLSDGSIIELTLGAGFSHSSLICTGGLWFFDSTAQTFQFNSGAAPGTYDNIISGLSGAEFGLEDIANWTVSNPEYAGSTFVYDDLGGVDLMLVAVPEPGAAVTLLSGLGVLVALRRRRG